MSKKICGGIMRNRSIITGLCLSLGALAFSGVAFAHGTEKHGRSAAADAQMKKLHDMMPMFSVASAGLEAALRAQRARARIFAILEPRSNTMKLGAVKAALPASLAGADRVFCYSGGVDWNVAEALASLGEIYIDDAFGAAHRAHASIAAMAEFFKLKAAGLLLQKELDYLSPILADPPKPFVTILGGAKVSDKIGVIRGVNRAARVGIVNFINRFTDPCAG